MTRLIVSRAGQKRWRLTLGGQLGRPQVSTAEEEVGHV